jgi:hypothetical protein
MTAKTALSAPKRRTSAEVQPNFRDLRANLPGSGILQAQIKPQLSALRPAYARVRPRTQDITIQSHTNARGLSPVPAYRSATTERTSAGWPHPPQTPAAAFLPRPVRCRASPRRPLPANRHRASPTGCENRGLQPSCAESGQLQPHFSLMQSVPGTNHDTRTTRGQLGRGARQRIRHKDGSRGGLFGAFSECCRISRHSTVGRS